LSPHAKKLIGAIVIIVWIPVYALFAMGIGVHLLPHASALGEFLYYALTGTLWIIPIGLMLPWMHRERKPDTHDNASS
jgi:hypothetical protein